MDLFAAGGTWAPAWAEAAAEADRTALATVLEVWQDVWSALGAVRRIVWGATHLLFGLAFIGRSGLARWVGVLFLSNAFRLLPRTAGSLLELPWLAGLGGGRWWFVGCMVPLFSLIGVWLWRDSPAPIHRVDVVNGHAGSGRHGPISDPLSRVPLGAPRCSYGCAVGPTCGGCPPPWIWGRGDRNATHQGFSAAS